MNERKLKEALVLHAIQQVLPQLGRIRWADVDISSLLRMCCAVAVALQSCRLKKRAFWQCSEP